MIYRANRVTPALRGLDNRTLLRHLEDLARTLSLPLRYEPLEGEEFFSPGGLCRIRGKSVLIINSRATTEDKIYILKRCLQSFDLSEIYLKPAIREFLGEI